MNPVGPHNPVCSLTDGKRFLFQNATFFLCFYFLSMAPAEHRLSLAVHSQGKGT